MDRWQQTKADVLRRCAERAQAAKERAERPALDSPKAIAELQRLWAIRALTLGGVAQRWSEFLKTKVSTSKLRTFVQMHKDQFPDRRALNYGAMSGSLPSAPHPYVPSGTRLRPAFVDEALQDAPFDAVSLRDIL